MMTKPSTKIILLVVLLIVIGGLLRWAVHANQPTALLDSAGRAQLEVTLQQDEIQYGEMLSVTIRLANPSTDPVAVTFPTSCTEPTVFLDDVQLAFSDRICAQVLTTVVLDPGNERLMAFERTLVSPLRESLAKPILEIELGEHELSIEIAGVKGVTQPFVVLDNS